MALLPSYRIASPVPTPALWHLVDDRGTYRPGETYRAKGWVRSLSADRQLQAWDGDGVDYVAYDGTGVEIARGRAAVTPAGSFDVALDIPAGANTGPGWVLLAEGSPSASQHPLLIAEYRRPDFEVTTSAGAGPYRRADPITVTATADYYTGGPLADATVTWQVTTSTATYSAARLGPLRLRPLDAVVDRGRHAAGGSLRRGAVLRARPVEGGDVHRSH